MKTIGPSSLYLTTVRSVASKFSRFVGIDLRTFVTDSMRFDIFWELFKETESNKKSKSGCWLRQELSRLEVFFAMLNIGHRRTELHMMFQATNQYLTNETLPNGSTPANLRDCLVHQTVAALDGQTDLAGDNTDQRRIIANAYNFACFLIDGGWYPGAECILRKIESLPRPYEALEVEARVKLLHVLSAYSMFPEADRVYRQLLPTVTPWNASSEMSYEDETPDRCRHRMRSVSTCSSTCMLTDEDESDLLSQGSTQSLDSSPNLGAFYSEFSSYYFVRSHYREAYDWSMEAIKLLHQDLSPKTIIDVLRQASKACVVRRQFCKAEILITEAVLLARETYGEKHPKYADCLVDYGFYLLNVDGVAKSVQAYKSALAIREKCFGSKNLLVAVGHEELAYASYVHEYSTGRFDEAKEHAEKSLDIMTELLPNNHLLLASSQRVLALILEEIAIDDSSKDESRQLLKRAEDLHLSALALAVSAFGEMNVQTAKHYGNLGRLFQTMEKFSEAEAMHLKAIEIKENIVGKFDYEVALSIGHLASLYNYDLNEFGKAETLYLRSIEIGLKLFGPGYSGLEYDYRGLIRVYQETQDWSKFLTYQYKLRDWKALRDARDGDMNTECSLLVAQGPSKPINQIVNAVIRWDETAEIEEGKTAQAV